MRVRTHVRRLAQGRDVQWNRGCDDRLCKTAINHLPSHTALCWFKHVSTWKC